ncbi:MAG TPA: Ig-like domain-containing protein [Fibrobacteria bacterium]|nr:Ig-like domain-containing protein [Fibrobacteria bacterium]
MKHRKAQGFLLALISFSALLILAACTTTDDSEHTLNMIINKDNDSLLTFDSLIVKVYSQDSSFSQELFHGVLRNPKQVASLPMDPRVGREYIVFLIGYKNGKVGVKKEFAVHGPGNYQSKDLLAQTGKDTVTIDPMRPEILAPSDTSIAEGDSLRFRVTVRTPWSGPTTLTLKDPISGAALDTVGHAPGEGDFTWRPNFDQGRTEPYAVTFVYTSADKRVEKSTRVKVLNVNRPPAIKPVQNQVVKEGASLEFKVEATDPDLDSVALTLDSLPAGARFTAGQFTWKPAPGQSGNYFLTLRATDGKAQDTLRLTITVGNVLPPPGKPIVKGKSPTQSKTPTWTWSSGGGGTGTYRYRLDNDDLSTAVPIADTSYIPPTELSEGLHALYVQEKNPDGVWSLSGRFSIVIDVTPPVAPAVSVPTLTNTPKPTWTWIPGPGNGSGSYRYKLDNADLRTGTTATASSNFTPGTALSDGPHTLYVQEQDSAGNWSATGTASVTVDLTPPAAPKVSLGQPSPTNLPKPVWTWVGGGNAGMGLFRSKLDDSVLTSGAASGTPLSFTPDAALKEGKHILYVQERDSAGNWSVSGMAQVILDFTPPAAPLMDSTPYYPLNSLKPVWTWKTGGEGTRVFRYRLDNSDLTGAAEKMDTMFTPSTSLSEGKHTFYIQERDAAGNWSVTSRKELVLALRGALGSTGLTRAVGNMSLAIGKSGERYFAYSEMVRIFDWGEILTAPTVKRFNGVSWETLGNPSVYGRLIGLSCLKLDANDIPYLCLRDSNFQITVARFENGKWQPAGNAKFTGANAGQMALAISPSGTPYVAFSDGSFGGKATVMRLNGAIWETVGSPGFSEGQVVFLNIALNSAGVPYFSYVGGDGTVRIQRFNSANSRWDPVGNFGLHSKSGLPVSIVVGQEDSLFMALATDESGGNGEAYKFNGSFWERIGGAIYTAGQGQENSISIAVDAGGTKYAAYTSSVNQNQVMVKSLRGSQWVHVGPPALSASLALISWIQLSPDGIPFVAIGDGVVREIPEVTKFSFDP